MWGHWGCVDIGVTRVAVVLGLLVFWGWGCWDIGVTGVTVIVGLLALLGC